MRKTKEWEKGSNQNQYIMPRLYGERNKLTETHLSIRGNDVI